MMCMYIEWLSVLRGGKGGGVDNKFSDSKYEKYSTFYCILVSIDSFMVSSDLLVRNKK